MKYPVSKIQKQFWLASMLHPQNTSYNIPGVFELDLMPDIDQLDRALKILLKRHDILRSHFDMINLEPVQIVNNEDQYTNLCSVKIINREIIESEVPQEIIDEINTPFVLNKAPLLRVTIFQYMNKIFLSIVFHHIIIDLHSKHIFSQELTYIYDALINNSEIKLPPVGTQYAEYAIEQNEWLNSEKGELAFDKLCKVLPDINSNLAIATDYQKPVFASHKGNRTCHSLSIELYNDVKKYCKIEQVTDFLFYLTAYFILLQQSRNQEEIVVGIPFTNRRSENYKDTIGCFVNILPISVDFTKNPDFKAISKQIRQQMLILHRNQEIPFVELVERIGGKRPEVSNPFFQAGFTFESLMELDLAGIQSKPMAVPREGAQLDLFLTMWEQDGAMHAYMEYANDLFIEESVQKYWIEYELIIQNQIDGISKIGKPEMDPGIKQILEWNKTFVDITKTTLVKRFEESVLKYPQHTALKYGSSTLSYDQFNRKANQLANYIIEKYNPKIGDIIAVSQDRSPELVIALYAIQKSGCAYLPIDPKTPKSRIEVIVEDAKPILALTFSSNSNFPEHISHINIEEILSNPLSTNEKNPGLSIQANDLAYLLYTSGSTGKPKGVMIEHQSVINLLEWMQFKYFLGENDSILLKTPVTFDVSVWELFWWFFQGASLAILPVDDDKNPEALANALTEMDVTCVIFVPSVFLPFVEYLRQTNRAEELFRLKYILQIGEVLNVTLVSKFNKLRSEKFNPLLINTYGPTEATVAVTYFECPNEVSLEKVFIGKPYYNTGLYVINEEKEILSVGDVGELVISGVQLSRGYLNRPDLNEKQFIRINIEGKSVRVYKTGDLATWNDSGNLDFIGRVDNQIKIRGFRVELGDIEAKLLNHENIHTCAVVLQELNSEQKVLNAYFVKHGEISLTDSELKKHLAEQLPSYMIPHHFYELETIPLNTSGKIDRKQLNPPAKQQETHIPNSYNELENKLLKIYSDILNSQVTDIEINFFDIGGDSLSGIRIVNFINEELGLNLAPIAIMQYPTIKELANHISGEDTQKQINEPTIHRRRRRR